MPESNSAVVLLVIVKIGLLATVGPHYFFLYENTKWGPILKKVLYLLVEYARSIASVFALSVATWFDSVEHRTF